QESAWKREHDMSKLLATRAWLRVLLTAGGMIVVAAAGCAGGPPRSGFLADYSGFQEAAEHAPVWAYVDPDGRTHKLHARIWEDRKNWNALSKYDRILIDPVVVHLRPHAKAVWLDPQRLDRLTQYMHDAAVAAVEDGYPVVDEPGENVLRFRAAITDVRPAIGHVPMDLDRRPARAWANSRPGAAWLEGEAVDSVSGERIVGLILSARGSYFDAFKEEDRWEHSRRAIDGLASYIREGLDEAHRGD
ncbi:MAG: DUF3313 domain-containing protein, partial [Phycisphaerales bacterium]